ncbi:hypothetical protein MRB53_034067 [Persea americana]|uniref:Uncharacterized protein n=1 Tax=Persea americana TaxID=3435 RepID=A0ACC2KWS7_PERAE|nr:hypothetical protein MRB53_034067 [Persea americana]
MSHDVARAIQNIHNAVVAAGLSTIKVTAAVASTVLSVSYPPSQGAFSAAAVSDMTSIVSVLAQIGSPLMANVYPYFAYAAEPRKFSQEYALITAQSPPIHDGNLDYWCALDAIVDSFYSAMERVGGPMWALWSRRVAGRRLEMVHTLLQIWPSSTITIS